MAKNKPIQMPAGGWRPRPHQVKLWNYMLGNGQINKPGKRVCALWSRRLGKDSCMLNILATIGGGSIIGMVVLGSAADRIGNRLTMIIGFILLSTALFWLVSAREEWMLYLIAGGFGFAQGGSSTTQSPLVATLFGLGSLGVILGALSPSFNMGAAAGPFLAGYVFDVTGSYQVAFLICAAIGVVGLVSTALLTPTKKS